MTYRAEFRPLPNAPKKANIRRLLRELALAGCAVWRADGAVHLIAEERPSGGLLAAARLGAGALMETTLPMGPAVALPPEAKFWPVEISE